MDVLPLLDELRILAQNGLEHTEDPYDRDRYERVLELTSEWYGRSVDLPAEEVRSRFQDEVGHVTPKVSADAAVFDADGQLLLQRRSDDGTWCLPGRYTEANESSAETAVRETREETGLVVEPLELVDVYTRKPGEYAHTVSSSISTAVRRLPVSSPFRGRERTSGTGISRPCPAGTRTTDSWPMTQPRAFETSDGSAFCHPPRDDPPPVLP